MLLLVLVFGFLLSPATSLELDTFYKYLQDNGSSTSECQEQKSAFLQGLLNGDAWAIKMLDAYGRIPQGLSQGHNIDLGMFDQCLNIFETLDATEIRGRYCYAGLIIPLLDFEVDPPTVNEMIETRISKPETNLPNILLRAACVPDACLPSDLFGPLGVDFFCQTKGETKKLKAADIACICFFALTAWFVISSTAYDVYLQKKSKEPKHEILLAFSAYSNGKKILKTSQDSGQILFFNGMKVLSMFWVITGHRYQWSQTEYINVEEAEEWKRKWYSVYVQLAPLAVDTFLFVSGALLAYTFLKTMGKRNQKFNIVIYYLHRYLRLTPALAALYFFHVTLSTKVVDGPMNPVLSSYFDDTCLDGDWWSFFLYLQNYVKKAGSMCLVHTWYLSVDMQLYVISPLLLLPMHYYGKRIAYLVLPVLVLITTTYTMLIFYFYNLELYSDDYNDMFYFVTHTRVPPWLIGLIFGAFLLDYQANKERYQIRNKWIAMVMWVGVCALTAFLFFYQDEAEYNPTRIKSTFFLGLQKPLWTLCLCWISYACLSGNAGIINSFLSMPVFQILSKVTYSTYLVHFTILLMSIGSSRALKYFTDYNMFRSSIADICVCYFIGTLWTLCFESPVLVLEKIVFGRGAENKKGNGNGGADKTSTSTEVGRQLQTS